MLAELVEKIAEQSVKAAGAEARVLRAAAEPPHVYYTVGAGGELERVEATPAPRQHRAGSVQTVCELASRWAEDCSPEIWYSRTGLAAVLDGDASRLERAALPLRESLPLATLAGWEKGGASLGHVEMVQAIRTVFADCLPAHPGLKREVSRVDIRKAQEAVGVVQAAKVSLSRSMVAEASGADRLPEVLTFDVPVFDSPLVPARAKVRAAFDLDPQSERFRLAVLPGEIEAARAAGEAYLLNAVAATLEALGAAGSVRVYHGTP